jgi:hypothetical protein
MTTATEGDSITHKYVSRPNHGTENTTHHKFPSFIYPQPGYKPPNIFYKMISYHLPLH